MAKREMDEVNALFSAVQKYVESRGGTVLVAGGPNIMRFEPNKQYHFQVVINCTGKIPPKPEGK